jgi:branched-chain amino acid transport system substrate-binding protein
LGVTIEIDLDWALTLSSGTAMAGGFMPKFVKQAIGAALLLVLTAGLDVRGAEPIRIVLIEDALPEQHGEAGFRLGLEVATVSALAAAGRPLAVTIVTAGNDPAAQLRAAYGEGKADIAIGLAGSEATLAMAPEAAAARRVLMVAAASAEAITGAARNRYVFRTAASDGQIALAAVLAFARPQQNLMVAAPDTADGRAAAATFKTLLAQRQPGTFFVGTWLLPESGEGLLEAAREQYEGLHYLHEARTLVLLGDVKPALLGLLLAADPGHSGVRIALAGALDPAAPPPTAPLDGVTPYHDALLHNPLNERLVTAWQQRFGARPDGAAADGMSAALALVAALDKADTAEGEALATALEGLHFPSPKGEMVLRAADHQAMQAIEAFHAEPQKGMAGSSLTLIREFTPADLAPADRAGGG